MTDAQKLALAMIRKFGRTTDKRAVNALAKKGLVIITREERLCGEWGGKGAIAFFGYVASPENNSADPQKN
jgi:hypothetical protein